MKPLPFGELNVPETGRMKPRNVNVSGEAYGCARQHVIRLEVNNCAVAPRLARLAGAAGITPSAFRQRFKYLVEQAT
jgi:6-phosphofructokinase 1